ncbi:hypothetical protein [Nocardia sp. NPDC052566]|uniref:hypothetical protein n=1 Tax=Nocardia sp. NPDC052566 TaxID=3364330 RepID=UPI0037C9C2A2
MERPERAAREPLRLFEKRATVLVIRLLVVGGAVLSCGMLGWVPFAALVVMTGRLRDGALAVAVCALDIGAIAVIAGDAEGTWKGDLGLLVLLATMVAGSAYYLVVDAERRAVRERTPEQPG